MLLRRGRRPRIDVIHANEGDPMKRRDLLKHCTAGATLLPLASLGLVSASCERSASPAEGGERLIGSAEPDESSPEWAGTVLQADEGEFIVSGRRRAPMRIKVDSRVNPGTPMSMLVSEVQPGQMIPVHLHRNEDEIIFIHTGEGIVTLGDQRVESSAGAMLYAPKGVWHGVENIGGATITWCAIWSPAGFEQYFKELSALYARPGDPPTNEQTTALGLRYGMEFRDG
jgi:quercetin dioxygenase-like cupin family protein